jgi:hypothetical protein
MAEASRRVDLLRRSIGDCGLAGTDLRRARNPHETRHHLLVGGAGHLLAARDRRGALPPWAKPADVPLYLNERAIHEVLARWERASAMRCSVAVGTGRDVPLVGVSVVHIRRTRARSQTPVA